MNAVHISGKSELLYTGDVDGLLAVWKFPGLLKSSSQHKRPKVKANASVALHD